MKIAGAFPIPNTKIATGSHATGDTGASSLIVGRVRLPNRIQKRIATPTAASARPVSTRRVVATTVISTAIAGLGPASVAAPICQRRTVLKNCACLGMAPRNTCGGGSSFGSAQPISHSSSQIAANRPIEAAVQPSCRRIVDWSCRFARGTAGRPSGERVQPRPSLRAPARTFSSERSKGIGFRQSPPRATSTRGGRGKASRRCSPCRASCPCAPE